MDTSWLEYCATEEQLKAFNDTGYLVVDDAISPEMVDALEAVADRLDAEERAKTGRGTARIVIEVPYRHRRRCPAGAA